MKKVILLILYFFLVKCHSQTLWQINKDTVITWHYFDGDDFSQSHLNTAKWDYWYGWTRSIFSHKEQQYYTDGANHKLENGILCLFAKRETVKKRTVDHLPDNDSLFKGKNYIGPNKQKFDYTSGMIQSKQRYLYGYFELKFRMPADKGFWPAFWLQGGYPNEEIDWMELKTERKNAIHVGRHSQKKEENILRKFIRKRPWGDWVFIKGNLSKDWHIISGEWAPGYLKYYLNGECIAYTKVSLPIEKTICINLAVPGNDGPFHPGPDTLLKRSGNFEIDYVRVWGKDKMDTTVILSQTLENKLGATTLRSKAKFLYGNKSIHKNEGIIVTLIPIGNNIYELQVSGKRIPKDAFYSITNEGSVPLISKNLNYGFTVIDLSEFKEPGLQLNIHYLKQTVKFPLSLN